MYETYEITPDMGIMTTNCNCGKKKDNKDCNNYKKIDLQSCGGSYNFAVANYFSELVHDWEKEAARYNLGILELDKITYNTSTDPNTNELITTVTFDYRIGHETFSRTFLCAPKGDKGDDGNDGASAYAIARAQGFLGNELEWLASLKADPARITSATVAYCGTDCNCCPSALVVEKENGEYELLLLIHKPELTTSDITNITNLISTAMQGIFYTKEEINNKIVLLESRIGALETIVNSLNVRYGGGQ